MTDGRQWQPAGYEAPHTFPGDAPVLAAPRQCALPSDRAGLPCTSRYRCTGWSLPFLHTASASRSVDLTRLNTCPELSPVSTSTPPARVAPHDSRPMCVPTSHSHDFFISPHLA